MLEILLARLKQGHRTHPLSGRGADAARPLSWAADRRFIQCAVGCRDCAEACPTSAISIDDKGVRLDLGRCLFCSDCTQACPEGAIRYTQEYRLATRTREDLVLQGETLKLAQALEEKSRRLFGRSLKLRQVMRRRLQRLRSRSERAQHRGV